jgi:hypothetical protein
MRSSRDRQAGRDSRDGQTGPVAACTPSPEPVYGCLRFEDGHVIIFVIEGDEELFRHQP